MNTNHDLSRVGPDLTGEPDAPELERVWELTASDAVVTVSAEETDQAWSALEARLFGAESLETTPQALDDVIPLQRTGMRRTAAGLSVAAAAAVVAFSMVPTSYTAARGEMGEVALPGGSVVELNAGSTLTWSRGFGWLPGVSHGDRVVQLDGEAFFSVTRNGRAFRVETADAHVTVLGTRFNVRSRADVPTRVTVEEGRVAVETTAGENRVELGAGDQGILDAHGRIAIDQTDDLRSLSWRDGALALRDLPLNGIVDELERRFDVHIEDDGVPTSAETMTLFYSAGVELETVLADLATARGLRYRATAEGWELYSG